MRKSKFLRLLKSLNKKEQREFHDYIQALYARQEKALALFSHIMKYRPDFESRKLAKEYVLENVLQVPDSNTKRVSNELHKLLNWLEDFLLWQRLSDRRNKLERQQLLIEEYRERKLDTFFTQAVTTTKKNLQKTPASIDRYLILQRLLHHQYYYSPAGKLGGEEKIITEALRCIEWYAALLKLKYGAELRSRANILQKDFSAILPEKTTPPPQVFKNDGLLYNLWEQLYDLTGRPTETTYHQLKALFLSRNSKILKTQTRLILLSYLINYTATLIKAGNRRGVEEAFELYKHGIQERIIFLNGYITESKFHNIINVACGLQAYDWAGEFVEKHRMKLPEQWQEQAVSLARARIAFGRSEFQRTIDLLNRTEFHDHAYTLQAKMLRIRCYYELRSEYETVLYSFLDSFDKFLRRNKTFHPQTINSVKNFLRLLRRLLKPESRRREMQSKLSGPQPVLCKSWLLEKVKELPR